MKASDAPYEPSKPCSHCGQRKTYGEFPADRMMLDGRASWCRECHRQATEAWRVKRRAQIAAKAGKVDA